MESLEIEDIASWMQILSPKKTPVTIFSGDVDWLCGHCDEMLIHRAGDRVDGWVVLRCPQCHRFSRFRRTQ